MNYSGKFDIGKTILKCSWISHIMINIRVMFGGPHCKIGATSGQWMELSGGILASFAKASEFNPQHYKKWSEIKRNFNEEKQKPWSFN